MTKWADADMRFRELVIRGGQSYRDIAEILSREFGRVFTRGSCIGYAFRKGLAKVTPAPLNGKPRKKRNRGSGGGIVGSIMAKMRRKPTPIIDPTIEPMASMRVTFAQLNQYTCRWPYGEGAGIMFCGEEPARGHPYCDHHCGLAYTPYARRG